MLPSFAKLRLDTGRRRRPVSTGEFFSLSAEQVAQLKRGGEREAFTTDEFQEDVEPAPAVPAVDGWHTFRVRSEYPRADGTYDYKLYRGESLWEHVKRGNLRDPITRGPIWYEDYMELHNKFAPGQPIPADVMERLRRRDAPAAAAPPLTIPSPDAQAYWQRIATRAAESLERNGAYRLYVESARNAPVPVPTQPLTEYQFVVITRTLYELRMSIQGSLEPSARPSYVPAWFTEIGRDAKKLIMDHGAQYARQIRTSDDTAENARNFVNLVVSLMKLFVKESTRQDPREGITITNFLSVIKVAWNRGTGDHAADDTDNFSLVMREPRDFLGGNATRDAYIAFQHALKEWYGEVANHPRTSPSVRSMPPTTLMDDEVPPAYVGERGVVGRSKVFERKYPDGSTIPASPDLLEKRLSLALAYMNGYPDATIIGLDAGARQAIVHFLSEKVFYENHWLRDYGRDYENGVPWDQRDAVTLLAMETFQKTGMGSNSEHWRDFQALLIQFIAQVFELDSPDAAGRLVASSPDAVRMFVNRLLVWKDEHWQLRRGDVVTDRPWQAAMAVVRALDPTALTPPPEVIAPHRQYTQPIEDEEMPQFRPISRDDEPPPPSFLPTSPDDEPPLPQFRPISQEPVYRSSERMFERMPEEMQRAHLAAARANERMEEEARRAREEGYRAWQEERRASLGTDDDEPPPPTFRPISQGPVYRSYDDDTPPRARQRTQLGENDADSLPQFTAGSEMDE